VKVAKGSQSEKPLIIAENLIATKKTKLLGKTELRKALLAFMPIAEMKDRFLLKKGKQLALSQYWDTWIRDDGMILAGPIFGGPMCAVVVEELSALGVRDFIGYGYSGCLDPKVSPGCIMVADASFCSDGTTKEYCTGNEVSANPEMLSYLVSLIHSRSVTLERGKVWTTDAIYREFPSKVKRWKNAGARFVNIETASLYAVARAKGLRAVYLSVVSDTLEGEKWSGWYDCKEALEQVWSICLEMCEKFEDK